MLNADNRNALLSEVDANPDDVASTCNYGITAAVFVIDVVVLMLLLRVAGRAEIVATHQQVLRRISDAKQVPKGREWGWQRLPSIGNPTRSSQKGCRWSGEAVTDCLAAATQDLSTFVDITHLPK
jgi:hypothetical protein